jgi:hypothetical protein
MAALTFAASSRSPAFDSRPVVPSPVAADVTDGVSDCGGSLSMVPVVDDAAPERSERTVLMLGRSEGMAVVCGAVWLLCVC